MAVLADWYLWIKALHAISVIAWMAGMLYLPRLFVYHAETPVGAPQADTFKVMERRLLRAIMNPAMIATWIFGLTLLATPGIVDWSAGWIYVKLVCIAAMTVLHHMFGLWRKDFEADRNRRAPKFYRVWNEVPAVVMVIIVIMVIVKPF